MIHSQTADLLQVKDVCAYAGVGDMPRILIVGNLSPWLRVEAGASSEYKINQMAYDQLDNVRIALMHPDLVLTQPWSAGFDCLDMAMLLQAAGFSGAYRVITDKLPNPALIRREILSGCPDLDFDFINPSHVPTHRLH